MKTHRGDLNNLAKEVESLVLGQLTYLRFRFGMWSFVREKKSSQCGGAFYSPLQSGQKSKSWLV